MVIFGLSSTAKSITSLNCARSSKHGAPLLHEFGHGSHRALVRGTRHRVREETAGNVCARGLGPAKRDAAAGARSLRGKAAVLRGGRRAAAVRFGNQDHPSRCTCPCRNCSAGVAELFPFWLRPRSAYLLQEHQKAAARAPSRIL